MAEIQPILLTVQPWDATRGISVYFTYTGARQALVNHLVVTDASTSEIVYSFEYSSFEKVHPLPPNHFLNGKVYKAKLRVKFDDGSYSPFSAELQFKTFSTPVLDITSIDGLGHVYNRDVTFAVQYSQANNEKVKTYRFNLYDENEDLLKSFPIRYPMNEGELTEVVEGLEKGKGYFIECVISTINGINYTHRERFIPMYIVPSVNGIISARNDKEEGFIRITANLKQVLGTQVRASAKKEVSAYVSGIENDSDSYDSDNYDYLNDEWIVIPTDKPLMFKGLGMNRASDFVFKLWCKDIPVGTKFAEISPAENAGIGIQFWKHTDRIVAVKEYNGITSRYTSNQVTIPSGVEYMLYVKVVEHRLELEIKLL